MASEYLLFYIFASYQLKIMNSCRAVLIGVGVNEAFEQGVGNSRTDCVSRKSKKKNKSSKKKTSEDKSKKKSITYSQ